MFLSSSHLTDQQLQSLKMSTPSETLPLLPWHQPLLAILHLPASVLSSVLCLLVGILLRLRPRATFILSSLLYLLVVTTDVFQYQLCAHKSQIRASAQTSLWAWPICWTAYLTFPFRDLKCSRVLIHSDLIIFPLPNWFSGVTHLFYFHFLSSSHHLLS